MKSTKSSCNISLSVMYTSAKDGTWNKWNSEDVQLKDMNGAISTKTEGQNRELHTPSHWIFLLEAVNCADRYFIFQKGM